MGTIKEKILHLLDKATSTREWKGVSIGKNNNIVDITVPVADHNALFANPNDSNIKKYANTVDKDGNLPIFYYLDQKPIDTKIIKKLWQSMDDVNLIITKSNHTETVLSKLIKVIDHNTLLGTTQEGKNIVEMMSTDNNSQVKPLAITLAQMIDSEFPLYTSDINRTSKSNITHLNISKACDKLTFEYCRCTNPAIKEVLQGLSYMGYNPSEPEYVKAIKKVDEPLFIEIATQCYRQHYSTWLYRDALSRDYIKRNKEWQMQLINEENKGELADTDTILYLNDEIHRIPEKIYSNDLAASCSKHMASEMANALGDKLPENCNNIFEDYTANEM